MYMHICVPLYCLSLIVYFVTVCLSFNRYDLIYPLVPSSCTFSPKLFVLRVSYLSFCLPYNNMCPCYSCVLLHIRHEVYITFYGSLGMHKAKASINLIVITLL